MNLKQKGHLNSGVKETSCWGQCFYSIDIDMKSALIGQVVTLHYDFVWCRSNE